MQYCVLCQVLSGKVLWEIIFVSLCARCVRPCIGAGEVRASVFAWLRVRVCVDPTKRLS